MARITQPRGSVALVVACLACVFVSSSCVYSPPGSPEPGQHDLSVPYHPMLSGNEDYCVPASVLMWLDYVSPINYSDGFENQIWDYAASRGWAAHGGGIGTAGVDNIHIPDVAQYFFGFGVNRLIYSPSEIRNAVADQEKNIDQQSPVLVEGNYGFHALLVVGTSWTELDDTEPRVDYMTVHDPSPVYPPFYHVFLNEWMSSKGTACSGHCVAHTSKLPYLTAQAELGQFDGVGGTYYGDPNPPQAGRFKLAGDGSCYWDADDFGPDQCSPPSGRWKLDGQGNCYWDPNDSGPDQCVPSDESPLRTSISHQARFSHLGSFAPLQAMLQFRRPGMSSFPPPVEPVLDVSVVGQQRPQAPVGHSLPPVRSTVKPPYPNAATRPEILANIIHSIRLTRLDLQEPGWGAFHEDGGVVMGRLLDVTSDSKPQSPDYYVVYLDDRSGAPLAGILISKAGVLMEAVNLKLGHHVEAPVISDVVRQLENRFTIQRADYYFAGNNVQAAGGSKFLPFVRVQTTTGALLVAYNGDMYREQATEPFRGNIEEETSNLPQKRPGQKLLIKTAGISTLIKVGSLSDK